MNISSYHKVTECRISGSKNLVNVLNLGEQALTGVFPKNINETITTGPIELLWCPDSGLLQLKHSYSLDEMYGDNYGYRSGLNQSMVKHLKDKVNYLCRKLTLQADDVVLDIGSNDATLLKSYPILGIKRIGIDPTANKFSEFYTDDIIVLPDFFSADGYWSLIQQPARIITSIAMFYDLENPLAFAKQINAVLHPEGIWHFEQSYMPSMLRTNSYDTICHEHLEYYSLGVVQFILEQSGFKIIDVQMNSINGGSFAVTAAKKENPIEINKPVIEWLLKQEHNMGLATPRPFRDFEERVYLHRKDLRRLIKNLKADGKKILGYGASTKGNVLLQFCGFTQADISAIADVNPSKYGSYTPGTGIPIISEEDARNENPDYFLVLPWHFRHGILEREKEFLEKGGKMIFPFPEIEII